jgi:hypothetical protein
MEVPADTRGFSVETPSGRVGRVAAVLPPDGSGGGVVLVHSGGRFCTLKSVRFEDVAHVDTESCRIVLVGSAPECGRSRRRLTARRSALRA